jgi:hypothetical protein
MIRAMDAPRAKACHNRYAFFMTVGDDTCGLSRGMRLDGPSGGMRQVWPGFRFIMVITMDTCRWYPPSSERRGRVEVARTASLFCRSVVPFSSAFVVGSGAECEHGQRASRKWCETSEALEFGKCIVDR